MQTWLISGDEPLPMDRELEAALSFGADTALDGGGIALKLGILNAQGRVYRLARSWDLTEYVLGCQRLECLGFQLSMRRPADFEHTLEDVFTWPSGVDPPSRGDGRTLVLMPI